LGLLKDGRLCVQKFAPEASSSDTILRLELYDGARFEAFADPPSAALIGRNLSVFFAAQNGDLWLSGERGTACYHEKKWRAFVSSDKTTPEAALSFAEWPDGKEIGRAHV